MFDIGQEVVCIDDSPTNSFGTRDLIKGKHYFIEWIGMWSHPVAHPTEILSVRLQGVRRAIPQQLIDLFAPFIVGIFNPDGAYEGAPFRATRFAPLQKKETDISSFKELLNPVEKRILEDA